MALCEHEQPRVGEQPSAFDRLASVGRIGWVMLLNVWGVIWRIQKRLIQWTRDNATNVTPMPDKANAMARQAFLASGPNAFLSVVIFFMGRPATTRCLGSKGIWINRGRQVQDPANLALHWELETDFP
jgi:hypothetical protein